MKSEKWKVKVKSRGNSQPVCHRFRPHLTSVRVRLVFSKLKEKEWKVKVKCEKWKVKLRSEKWNVKSDCENQGAANTFKSEGDSALKRWKWKSGQGSIFKSESENQGEASIFKNESDSERKRWNKSTASAFKSEIVNKPGYSDSGKSILWRVAAKHVCAKKSSSNILQEK